MRMSFFLASFLLVVVSSSPAKGQYDDPALRTKSVEISAPDSEGLYAYGGSGLGIFQDIQVPINEFDETRGDGSAIAEENKDHVGLPLFVGLGYRRSLDNIRFDLASIEGTQIRSTSGPSATQSSSYTRIELSSGASYSFKLGYTDMWMGARAGIRRSFFSNVSNSHFVESGIFRLATGLERGSFGISGFFGFAPVSRVGYSSEGFTGGKYFKKASATVSEAGITAALKLKENTYFDLGIEQESIAMSIDDIMEYNGFGLNVSPALQTSREYQLSTIIAKAGFRKLF